MNRRLLSILISLFLWGVSAWMLIKFGVKIENAVQSGAVFVGLSAFIFAIFEEIDAKKSKNELTASSIKRVYLFSRVKGVVTGASLLIGAYGLLCTILILSEGILINNIFVRSIFSISMFIFLYFLCGLYVGAKTIEIHFLDIVLTSLVLPLIFIAIFIFTWIIGALSIDMFKEHWSLPVFTFIATILFYTPGVYVGTKWRYILYVKKIIYLLPREKRQKALIDVANEAIKIVKLYTSM